MRLCVNSLFVLLHRAALRMGESQRPSVRSLLHRVSSLCHHGEQHETKLIIIECLLSEHPLVASSHSLINTQSSTHTHQHTHTSTHTHPHTHIHTLIHTHSSTHSSTHTHPHTHTSAHTHTHPHTLIHTYSHSSTHTHTLATSIVLRSMRTQYQRPREGMLDRSYPSVVGTVTMTAPLPPCGNRHPPCSLLLPWRNSVRLKRQRCGQRPG